MQHRKFTNVIKITSLIFISIVIITSLQSCAKKITFLSSSEVPAASGKVKVKKDKNKNYNIGISIDNLAPSTNLHPSANTYVVWAVTSNETKNLGQINSSSGFLSSKLKASFNAVSPAKPNKVFITAEDNGNAFYPNNRVVLTTANF
ncbi:MAG: hypothetical protein ABI297_06450 [Ginsengibacter sp.]